MCKVRGLKVKVRVSEVERKRKRKRKLCCWGPYSHLYIEEEFSVLETLFKSILY